MCVPITGEEEGKECQIDGKYDKMQCELGWGGTIISSLVPAEDDIRKVVGSFNTCRVGFSLA